MSIGEFTPSSYLLTAASEIEREERDCFAKKNFSGVGAGLAFGLTARVVSLAAFFASLVELVVATPIQLLRTVIQIGAGEGGDKLERIARSSKAVALRALVAPVASALSVVVPEQALGTHSLDRKLVAFGIDDVVQRTWWKERPGYFEQEDKKFRVSLADRAIEFSKTHATNNVTAAYLSINAGGMRGAVAKVGVWAAAAAETNLDCGSSEEIFFKYVGATKLEKSGLILDSWQATLYDVLKDRVKIRLGRLFFSPGEGESSLAIEGPFKGELLELKRMIDAYKGAPELIRDPPVFLDGSSDPAGDLHQKLYDFVTKFRHSPIGQQIWSARDEAGLHLPRGL